MANPEQRFNCSKKPENTRNFTACRLVVVPRKLTNTTYEIWSLPAVILGLELLRGAAIDWEFYSPSIWFHRESLGGRNVGLGALGADLDHRFQPSRRR